MKIKRHWLSYFLVFLAAAGLKYLYGSAGSGRLLWLLAPTVRWVRFLSGLGFIYEPGVGYVNHAYRFIIAPSCAGVRFLIICMLMLVCSFVSRMETQKKGLFWTALSLSMAYLATVFVNGLRILTAIFLPGLLEKMGFSSDWLSPERLHTAIGTAVYLLGLTVLYRMASLGAERISCRKSAGAERVSERKSTEAEQILIRKSAGFKKKGRRMLRPVLWYCVMVLGVPLLHRILRNDYENFAEYALRVMVTCAAVSLLLILLSGLRDLPGWLTGFFSDKSKKKAQQRSSL